MNENRGNFQNGPGFEGHSVPDQTDAGNTSKNSGILTATDQIVEWIHQKLFSRFSPLSNLPGGNKFQDHLLQTILSLRHS